MDTASVSVADANFLIRKPCAGEEQALAELHVECWRQTYSRLLPPGYFSQDLVVQRLSMWQTIVGARAELPIAVAERDGVLIGFALAGAPTCPNPPRPLKLYNLYLHADHHGCGAGQALLDAVIGEQPAFLWVAQDNPRAQAFYARNRFQADGTLVTEDIGLTEALLIR